MDDCDFYFDISFTLDGGWNECDEMEDEAQIKKEEQSIMRQEHLAQIRKVALKFKIRREFNWNHQRILWIALKKKQFNKRRKKAKKCYFARLTYDNLLLMVFSFLNPNFDYHKVYGGITRLQRKSLIINDYDYYYNYESGNNSSVGKKNCRRRKGKKRSFLKMNE